MSKSKACFGFSEEKTHIAAVLSLMKTYAVISVSDSLECVTGEEEICNAVNVKAFNIFMISFCHL